MTPPYPPKGSPGLHDPHRLESVLAGLGQSGFTDAQGLAKLSQLMEGMNPAALRLRIALVPTESLDNWNTAITQAGFVVGNDYRRALSNLRLQALGPEEVRRFMASLRASSPRPVNVFDSASATLGVGTAATSNGTPTAGSLEKGETRIVAGFAITLLDTYDTGDPERDVADVTRPDK